MNVNRQRVVFTFLLLLVMQSVRADTARPVPNIVFVCEHGSVKSLIAASYFNRGARLHGLPYRAVARGTTPERTVPAPVQRGLRAIGVDVSSYVPQLFRDSDLQDTLLVVSFDQDIDARVTRRMRHLKWDGLPAVLTDYARGRDAIVRQVDSLIEALARDRYGGGGGHSE